jgi:hypothetical protein
LVIGNHLTRNIQTITINVQENVLDKVMYLLKNLSDIEIVDARKKSNNQKDEKWTYWRDEELDNFGKIAIGLSKQNYDNEDYSKW